MPKNLKYEAKNLKKLPVWGRVAVIARALRRAMPLIAAMLDKNSKKILKSIEFSLQQVEDSAADGTLSEHLLWSCNRLTELARTVVLGSDDCDEDYTRDAIVAAYLVTTCCINADEEIEIEAIEAISNVVLNFERFSRRKAVARRTYSRVLRGVRDLLMCRLSEQQWKSLAFRTQQPRRWTLLEKLFHPVQPIAR